MSIKDLAYQITPPIIWHFLKYMFRKPAVAVRLTENLPQGWCGPFTNWSEALENSTGYNTHIILEKVLQAALKVKNGEAAYERDSVNFDQIQYAWPVAAVLLHIALQSNNKLHVIDFGGSLGTSYFQNKPLLKGLDWLKWDIIEQTHFAEAGNKYIAGSELSFFNSINEAVFSGSSNVFLSSGALQYIENYQSILDTILNLNFPFIILDRIPVCSASSDTIYVQNVPASIYSASYPTYFFSESKLTNALTRKYELIAQFDSACDSPVLFPGNIEIKWKGYFLKRKSI